MRPYLLFVSGITGIAGLSFTEKLNTPDVVIIFAAAFLSYGFGQVLTDCFQIDTDSISSPYRPLTQNIVSRKQFLIVSILGLLFCITIFSFYNPINLLLGLFSGIGLYTYTFFKKRWWGGPFYNSWIVAVLFIICLSCGAKIASTGHQEIIFTLLVIFFGYANFVVAGYFKDTEADRATHYNTIVVVYGRKLSSIVSDVFSLLALGFAVSVFLLERNILSVSLISHLFLLAAFIQAVIGQIRLHKVTKDIEAHKPITNVLHSYILLLSFISSLQKPEWGIYLIVFYFLFIGAMKIRPSENQI
jgi:4-hydroxybenzoate polyprenyltransferase